MSPSKRYEMYKKYLLMKFEEEDWHGVADAAMDIRDLISRHPGVIKDSLAWKKEGGR